MRDDVVTLLLLVKGSCVKITLRLRLEPE